MGICNNNLDVYSYQLIQKNLVLPNLFLRINHGKLENRGIHKTSTCLTSSTKFIACQVDKRCFICLRYYLTFASIYSSPLRHKFASSASTLRNYVVQLQQLLLSYWRHNRHHHLMFLHHPCRRTNLPTAMEPKPRRLRRVRLHHLPSEMHRCM